ncbi:hypothetical protein FBB35_14040 [Nostoc sp. TCL240-02]|nr:hypothetical protein FBB35_14040 [Nostoc sp. TCL240-02]
MPLVLTKKQLTCVADIATIAVNEYQRLIAEYKRLIHEYQGLVVEYKRLIHEYQRLIAEYKRLIYEYYSFAACSPSGVPARIRGFFLITAIAQRLVRERCKRKDK